MIDLQKLRQDSGEIGKLIQKKDPNFNIDGLLNLDEKVRKLKSEIENLRAERKKISSRFKIPAMVITTEDREKSLSVGKEISEKEDELVSIEEEFTALALRCPNIPFDDVPEGDKDKNETVRTEGKKPEFNFDIKNHVDLNKNLGWVDFEGAAAISGSNFAFYRGEGLKLLYALTNLMIKNNVSFGFEPVLPPFLIKEKGLFNSGNLPKFRGDFYECKDDGLCLIPTAEVPLANLYAEKIISAEDLPIRMTSWTGCFRREAGTHGSQERGLIRIHQFEKVELYTICSQEKSHEELDLMLSCAEKLLKSLGLHYRISLLAAQDCSFASAKTYDIEVWLPGQDRYYEVSSCSNCTDFQARRAKIRYRGEKSDEKPKLAHTLNASSLALPRLMVALMENYQQSDGSIKLPEILHEAMNSLW